MTIGLEIIRNNKTICGMRLDKQESNYIDHVICSGTRMGRVWTLGLAVPFPLPNADSTLKNCPSIFTAD